MPRLKTTLTSAPPYEVSQALTRLGASLRTARLRRNLTLDDVARKIGSGTRSVMHAEKGRPGSAAAVYVALLWAYDLLPQLDSVADPSLDTEGLSRIDSRERARAPGRRGLSPSGLNKGRRKGRLDNDF